MTQCSTQGCTNTAACRYCGKCGQHYTCSFTTQKYCHCGRSAVCDLCEKCERHCKCEGIKKGLSPQMLTMIEEVTDALGVSTMEYEFTVGNSICLVSNDGIPHARDGSGNKVWIKKRSDGQIVVKGNLTERNLTLASQVPYGTMLTNRTQQLRNGLQDTDAMLATQLSSMILHHGLMIYLIGQNKPTSAQALLMDAPVLLTEAAADKVHSAVGDGVFHVVRVGLQGESLALLTQLKNKRQQEHPFVARKSKHTTRSWFSAIGRGVGRAACQLREIQVRGLNSLSDLRLYLAAEDLRSIESGGQDLVIDMELIHSLNAAGETEYLIAMHPGSLLVDKSSYEATGRFAALTADDIVETGYTYQGMVHFAADAVRRRLFKAIQGCKKLGKEYDIYTLSELASCDVRDALVALDCGANGSIISAENSCYLTGSRDGSYNGYIGLQAVSGSEIDEVLLCNGKYGLRDRSGTAVLIESGSHLSHIAKTLDAVNCTLDKQTKYAGQQGEKVPLLLRAECKADPATWFAEIVRKAGRHGVYLDTVEPEAMLDRIGRWFIPEMLEVFGHAGDELLSSSRPYSQKRPISRSGCG